MGYELPGQNAISLTLKNGQIGDATSPVAFWAQQWLA